MKAAAMITAAYMLLASVAACTRTVYTPVESASSDSLYRSAERRDTLYLLDSVRVEVRGDSVKETRQRTLYRTVILTDTLRETMTDTVRIVIPPEKARGDTLSWRLPAILAAALVLCLIFLRKITKG